LKIWEKVCKIFEPRGGKEKKKKKLIAVPDDLMASPQSRFEL
jgi:hypothetical protein